MKPQNTAVVKAPRMLFSERTGEQYSASRGDYFWMNERDYFVDSRNRPMDLVQTRYNELGNLEVAHIIKVGPVTKFDLEE